MYIHQDITSQVINACFIVHNELGSGFLERVYQEALAVVLKEKEVQYEREKHLPIIFHG